MPASLTADLQVHRGWLRLSYADTLLALARQCFRYAPGELRATGCLYAETDGIGWTAPLECRGPELAARLEEFTGTRFAIAAFQAYRDGSGCGWHADTPFGTQAILSLGVTRTFGTRQAGGQPRRTKLAHGDLVVMPDGFQRDWEHCVPAEDVPGERIALVFRTPAGEAA